jgi:hypothetical protein
MAQAKKETFFCEEILQSLNKFLKDLITWEVVFFNDFFDLNVQSSSLYLNSIFKSSVNVIFDMISRNIQQCNDFFALSLMIIVNHEQRKLMENIQLNHLDFYFGRHFYIKKSRYSAMAKLGEIFNLYITNIFKVNLKNTKLLINGIHTVTYKLGEFLGMLNLLLRHSTSTDMLTIRIKIIQKSFNKFSYEICENMNLNNTSKRDEIVDIFFINNLYYLLTKLRDFQFIFLEDSESFDKTFNNKIESYVNILIKKYLKDIHKIISISIIKTEEVESSNVNTTRDINKSIFDPNEINFNIAEVEKLTKNELKLVSANFTNKYRDLF